MLVKEWVPMLHRKNLPQPNPEATAPKESDQAVADDAGKKPAPPKKTYDFLFRAAGNGSGDSRCGIVGQGQSRAAAPAGGDGAGANQRRRHITNDATRVGFQRTLFAAGCFHHRRQGCRRIEGAPVAAGLHCEDLHDQHQWKVYNRVRVGPFSTASDTEAARKTLTDSGINAIPIAEKPGQ